MTRRLHARIVAAITAPLVVAATCVLGQSPATAAMCTSDAGVSVVVDSGALGASIATVCDPGSGEVASNRFEQSGFMLTYAQRQPGFVCRVNGVPAGDPCVNTSPVDAYWGLFWTDGRSGTWTYATLGATSLDVSDGGAVALAWQQGAARRTPAVAAPVLAAPSPSPSPSKEPTPTATEKPTPQPTRTPTATRTPSAPTAAPTMSATTAPSTSPTSSMPSSPTGSPATTESPSGAVTDQPSEATTEPSTSTTSDATNPTDPRAAEEESSRVPTWLTLTTLVSLLLAIGISTHAARRRTRH